MTLTATVTANKVVYSDVNPDLSDQNNLELVFNEDSINKSIVTILTTRKKSRPFLRAFGSYVEELLFQPLTSDTASIIQSELLDAVSAWETRIKITKSEVIPDTTLQAFYVYLEYDIPELNSKGSFSFNLKHGE